MSDIPTPPADVRNIRTPTPADPEFVVWHRAGPKGPWTRVGTAATLGEAVAMFTASGFWFVQAPGRAAPTAAKGALCHADRSR